MYCYMKIKNALKSAFFVSNDTKLTQIYLSLPNMLYNI